jgi:hypothetical protein
MVLPQLTTALAFGAGVAAAAAASSPYRLPKSQPSNAVAIDATPVGPSYVVFLKLELLHYSEALKLTVWQIRVLHVAFVHEEHHACSQLP